MVQEVLRNINLLGSTGQMIHSCLTAPLAVDAVVPPLKKPDLNGILSQTPLVMIYDRIVSEQAQAAMDAVVLPLEKWQIMCLLPLSSSAVPMYSSDMAAYRSAVDRRSSEDSTSLSLMSALVSPSDYMTLQSKPGYPAFLQASVGDRSLPFYRVMMDMFAPTMGSGLIHGIGALMAMKMQDDESLPIYAGKFQMAAQVLHPLESKEHPGFIKISNLSQLTMLNAMPQRLSQAVMAIMREFPAADFPASTTVLSQLTLYDQALQHIGKPSSSSAAAFVAAAPTSAKARRTKHPDPCVWCLAKTGQQQYYHLAKDCTNRNYSKPVVVPKPPVPSRGAGVYLADATPADLALDTWGQTEAGRAYQQAAYYDALAAARIPF